MIPGELKTLRTAIGLTQAEMAHEMGLALRRYQELERGKERIRSRHANSAERLSLHFAVVKKNPMLALPIIRQESLDLVDMIRGHSPVAAPNQRTGGFHIVEIEFGAFGEMVARRVLQQRYETKQDADREAERLAKRHLGKSGYNEEHGYWWGRELDGKARRFVVEAV